MRLLSVINNIIYKFMHPHSSNSIANNTRAKEGKLIKLSTYATVAGVSLIIIAKIFGWFLSESVTMLASLVDSLLDICVSMMNLIAVHYALQPADHEHRFGHEKVEDIAVFSQAVFFGLSGIFLIITAIKRFFYPNNNILNEGNASIEILLFSTVITLLIVIFQYYVMNKAKSNILKADSLHYITDFLTNAGAIIGIAITTYWQLPMFDNITAIAIAIYIIFISTKLLKKSFNNLMDHELDEKERKMIIEIIKAHKEVLGFHDLKTRYAGVKPFIQFHLELDKNMPLKETHHITEEIEEAIIEKLPNAEIIIHQDPEGVEEAVSYIDD